ncbi:beta-lactamase regulating signal transducer with metallopeptidase domain [Anaerotaenia torta]|uniref:M56 family metallopeptidase n=1 Tax=Anaerotaenia torta TaxID=433293 RepID=UPI003D19B4BE
MWLYTLLPKILNMSLTAGIVILSVLIARIPLRKAPRSFSYALWAVVLFRLVCPVSFSSELSLLGIFHTPAPTNNSITYIPSDIVHSSSPQVELPLPGISEAINRRLPRGQEQTVADPLEWRMAAATIVWLSGMAAMLLYSGISLLLLRRKLIGAVHLRDNIYLADHIPTPFVLGVLRPKIFLPSTLEEREQSYILLHEQTHIRRLDHIFKVAAFLALTVHWFNPLVWVAFTAFAKDMEVSCDEYVLRKMGEEIRQAYSASLLSLATGRHWINGSPLAFGEGNIKERIRNAMRFKKPAVWISIASILLVAALSIGLAANQVKSDPSSGWKPYRFPAHLYDRVTLRTEANVYPPSFEAIQAVLTNEQMESSINCGLGFVLTKQVGDDWRIVPFREDLAFTEESLPLPLGSSQTYRLTPDLLSVKLDAGNYRLATDVWYPPSELIPDTSVTREKRTVWAEFTIALPDHTGWQDVRIGMPREDVQEIMGEPVGMLFGFFGDIYLLENGSQITIYYDSEALVSYILLTQPQTDTSPSTSDRNPEDAASSAPDRKPADTSPSGPGNPQDTSGHSAEAPSEMPAEPALELIAEVTDLDRDGQREVLCLDRSGMGEGYITLRVFDKNNNEIWSEDADLPHAGWQSLFLCELEGEYYFLRYNPSMYQGSCYYYYTLFTLEGGQENIIQSNQLEFDINGTKELDVSRMIAFAEEVNELLDSSTLLMSTEGGQYTFGPSSSEDFLERYSWLDSVPKLYSDSDNLETRLSIYSDYAISNRKLSEEQTYLITETELAFAKDAVLSYYETTVFKGQVTDIAWLSDAAEYQSSIIPHRVKDQVTAFHVTMSDHAVRQIVLTKSKDGEWEVINEGV